jgi:hypothetical protein
MGGDTSTSGGDGTCICYPGNCDCKKWNEKIMQYDLGACSGTGAMGDPSTCSLDIGATSCVAPIMG